MDSPQKRRAWLAVVSAYQLCAERYEAMLCQFDLSTPQFELLNVIHELGGTAQPKEVAEHLLVTKGNITGLIRRLSAAGWVSVSPHPSDGRSLHYQLTSRAEKVVMLARRAAAVFIHQQGMPFSPKELTQIEELMLRMKVQLQQMDVVKIARQASAKPATAEAKK